MPAIITHYQFALRVISKLKKSGIDVPDSEMALIGAQGPDIFFFHRVLPWQRGESQVFIGRKLHRTSPARIFEGFREVLKKDKQYYNLFISYIIGFFCHYALDRSCHPYIYWAQEKLAEDDPIYGTKPYQYHFRIESALDTIVLRRETGRLICDFDLMSTLPKDSNGRYNLVGKLYHDLIFRLYGITVSADLLSLAPGDMRHALFFMNDRSMFRQKFIFRPIEKLTRKGRFATSLLRPINTQDWDYVNESHAQWFNPHDNMQVSTDSFFNLYDIATNEASDMIKEFLSALPDGKTMQEITQDRGFASDLPGVYDENSNDEVKGGFRLIKILKLHKST